MLRILMLFVWFWSLLLISTTSFAQNDSSHSKVNNQNHLYILKTEERITNFPDSIFLIQIQKKNHYLVKILNKDRLENNPRFEILPLTISDKFNESHVLSASKKGSYYSFLIKTLVNADVASVQEKIKSIGGKIIPNKKYDKANLINVWLPMEQFEALASIEDVIYIDPEGDDIRLNKEAVAITNTSLVQNDFPLMGDSLLGEGIVVGVGDDGNPEHVDINDRLIENFSLELGNGHGVHTTVTTAGAGIKDQRYSGFARKSSIIGQFFSGVLFYGDDLYNDYGMRVTNNSYANNAPACVNFGFYNLYSQFIDSQMWRNPELLHVFAAGNYATYNCEPFPNGYGTVASSYQSSKNALVVGNLGKHIYNYNHTTSRGPTRDGRLKPEIMAQGMRVISGGKNNTYYSNTGTSMAAPNVAGAATILAQFYKQIKSATPQSDLLKTLLMNGAQDIYNSGPDYISGFGLMDLKQSLMMLQQNHYLEDSIGHIETKDYTINVPEGVKRLKVMLYWMDQPINPGADTSLINDIDLSMPLNSGTILPWTLNPQHPTQQAIRGIDRLNNVEQITIDNPSSGDYPISINGYNVVNDFQRFIVAYDFEMDNFEITYPVRNAAINSGDSFYCYYKLPQNNQPFNIEFSADNGANWSVVATNYQDSLRHFIFALTDTIHSTQCKIRITELGSGRVAISPIFSITKRPELIVSTIAKQCPGSFSIEWNAIPNTEFLVIYRNIEGVMTAVDTVFADVFEYTMTGLPIDKEEWLAVAPIVDGQVGIRSIAVSRVAYDGECVNELLPEYDAAIIAIVNPKSGRALTSSVLTENEILSVKIQNHGANTISSLAVNVDLNDTFLFSETITLALAPGNDTIIHLDSTVNFSSIGNYNLKIYLQPSTQNLITINDTIAQKIKHIANPVFNADIGYVENFESADKYKIIQKEYIGLEGSEAWDYYKTDGFGRIRNFVFSSNNIEGNRSLTLDLYKNAFDFQDSMSTNQLIYTINLSDLEIDNDELRMDFLYRYAGFPKYAEENAVFIRGNDTNDWIKVKTIDTTEIASIHQLKAISINDFLINNEQSFSTSTQFKIQQKDTGIIVGPDYGNALTIDSFRAFVVNKDAEIIEILNPLENSCFINDFEKIQIKVRNSAFSILNDVSVTYQINNSPPVTENIPIINPKTEIVHTFSPDVDFSKDTIYNISVWIETAGDEYRSNDSILNHLFYKKKSVQAFPFYSSFEDTTQSILYVKSDNSAWSNSSSKLLLEKGGANGNKCWNTQNIADRKDTKSWLYSPCFDISTFQNPYLSFSFAGNFPVSSDSLFPIVAAFVEYSIDGKNWIKMDNNENAYNWYNSAWTKGNYTWQVASNRLPSADRVVIRFAYFSQTYNPAYSFAIDDLHIYDKGKWVTEDIGNTSATKNISVNDSIVFESDENIIATVVSTYKMGRTQIGINNWSNMQRNDAMEYIFPTNFVVKKEFDNNHKTDYAFFVPHKSFVRMNESNICEICTKVKTPYLLGITNYFGPQDQWDSLLTNNSSINHYKYIHNDSLQIIPYLNGYIFKFKTENDGEFWFNDGGVNRDASLIELPIMLTAEQLSPAHIKLKWISKINDFVDRYFVERLDTMGNFEIIYEVAATDKNEDTYFYYDRPNYQQQQAEYRVSYLLKGGMARYTNAVKVFWDNEPNFVVIPNPIRNNSTLEIGYNLQNTEPIHLRILDATGKQLNSFVFPILDKIGWIKLDTSRLGIASGIYFFQFQSGSTKKTQKVVFIP